MNMQANATETVALRTKLRGLTFKSADALAKKLKGGPVGFNPFTRFSATNGSPMVHQYAEWMLQNFNHAAIAANVDAYMERSRAARAHIATKRGIPLPAANPAPTNPEPATPQPDANPEPVETTATEADTPEPEYPAGSIESMIAAIVRAAMARQTAGVNPAQVIDIVKPVIDAAIERAKLPRVTHIHVTRTAPNGETYTVTLGRQHKMFPRLLARCGLRGADGNRLNIWLTGPAGSGKTTAAIKVAEALGLEFYHTGALDTEYKLLGFTDAQGRVVSTAFRKAWENGGVFLFDEVDASLPGAIMALNAALANGHCAFPDGSVARHKDCVIIAAANTWGAGATFEYVGRNKLDSASLDRFVKLAWEYDEELERDTSGNEAWCRKVQAWRRTVSARGIKHIISPRATYTGAAMLADGIPEAEVIEELITAGLSEDNRRVVMGAY